LLAFPKRRLSPWMMTVSVLFDRQIGFPIFAPIRWAVSLAGFRSDVMARPEVEAGAVFVQIGVSPGRREFF
jgi:hypothetical protein